MIVFTSAKSRLIKPGTAIKSEIPCTPCRRTLSASRNASSIGVFLSTTPNNRSFGMIIKVSTAFLIASIPLSAFLARLRPSNVNGRVTIPMVSAPNSRAILGNCRCCSRSCTTAHSSRNKNHVCPF